jgi:uncharacterized phage protein gp47/JayE
MTGFSRPTIAQLLTRTEADLAQRLGLGALLPNSVLKAFAGMVAGLAHSLHGHIDFQVRQQRIATADTESLDQLADQFGAPRKASTFAQGQVTFTGIDSVTIPDGTSLLRADGLEFSTQADGVIGSAISGEVSVLVKAAAPGFTGNEIAGQTLTIVSPISGVDPAQTVGADGITGGLDTESDDNLRARALALLASRPQGGASADYGIWAREVAGVTRAFVIDAHFGLGTVGLTFVIDDHPTSIIPDAAKVAEVQSYVDPLRPVTANVTTFAPASKFLNANISIKPNTAAVQASVTAAIKQLLIDEAEPGKTLPLSQVSEAISNAPGEIDHSILTLASLPAANVTTAAGEILLAGTPVFFTLA